jgi:homoserine O-acetyltransferase/O-succinyltransferase
MTGLSIGAAPTAWVGRLPADRMLAGIHGGRVALDRVQCGVWGREHLPTVVVLGGISADHRLCPHTGDRREGWWPGVVGPGAALDPSQVRVIGVDHAVVDGAPTDTRDQAEVLRHLLDHLEVEYADAIVGASYGGMTALAFGALHPTRVRRLVVCCAAHESHPMATALRLVQRRIVAAGIRHGTAHEALATARALGMATYRTATEFAGRFRGRPDWSTGRPVFPVSHYLDHHGARFARQFDPERYLALSESLDLHRLDPEQVRVPVRLIASRHDTVVPLAQVRELAGRLSGPARLQILDAVTGHDAFLTEAAAVSRVIRSTLFPEQLLASPTS